jgi:Adenylate kinase and related kinases
MRREREEGTDLGREAGQWTSHGRLFPDEIAMQVVRRWLSEQGTSKYLFDGFPRTVGQARAFDEELGASQPEIVFHLALPDDVIRTRVADRITCGHCGATFSHSRDGVAEGAVCPKCDHPLERRNDDTPAALEERLEQHRALTEPLLGYYGSRIVEIDAASDRDSVFQQICDKIEEAVPA